MHSAQYFQLVSLSPQHLRIWPLRRQTLAFCTHTLEIWLGYLGLPFPKVATFTCSFGACDVSVSVFNMSFSGADVRGLDLVRAAETGWSAQPINSLLVLCDLFRLPLSLWSRRPNQWTYALPNRLQSCVSGRSVKRYASAQRGFSDKAIGTKAKRENNILKQLTPTFELSS